MDEAGRWLLWFGLVMFAVGFTAVVYYGLNAIFGGEDDGTD